MRAKLNPRMSPRSIPRDVRGNVASADQGNISLLVSCVAQPDEAVRSWQERPFAHVARWGTHRLPNTVLCSDTSTANAMLPCVVVICSVGMRSPARDPRTSIRAFDDCQLRALFDIVHDHAWV